MYTQEQMDAWKTSIEQSTNITQTASKVSEEMMSLGEQAGYNQSQIIEIMVLAREKGAPQNLFDNPIAKTKMDNISFFN